MDSVPKSQYYFTNKISSAMMAAIENLVGKHGFKAILNLSGLTDLAEHALPDDYEPGLSYTEIQSINSALEQTMGARGGRGLAFQAGRMIFDQAIKNLGVMAGAAEPDFQALPLQERMRMGIPALIKILSQTCDLAFQYVEWGQEYHLKLKNSPFIEERENTDQPVCWMISGLLTAGFFWISGGQKFSVTEIECQALGQETCQFLAVLS